MCCCSSWRFSQTTARGRASRRRECVALGASASEVRRPSRRNASSSGRPSVRRGLRRRVRRGSRHTVGRRAWSEPERSACPQTSPSRTPTTNRQPHSRTHTHTHTHLTEQGFLACSKLGIRTCLLISAPNVTVQLCWPTHSGTVYDISKSYAYPLGHLQVQMIYCISTPPWLDQSLNMHSLFGIVV